MTKIHVLVGFIVVVVFSFLSPLPLMAVEASSTPTPNLVISKMDGVNKKKKRGAKKKTGSVKPVVAPQRPYVEIVSSTGRDQLVINWYRGPLPIEQSMQQVGDKAVTLKTGEQAAEDFQSSKDKQFAERFVNQFKTREAYFLRVAGNGKRIDQVTIALNRDSWTEDDIAAVRALLESLVAPTQFAYIRTASGSKPLLLPTALNTLPKQD